MRATILTALLVPALLLCEPALAVTWTEPDVATLQGSLVPGDDGYLELPWSVIWQLDSIVPGAALDPRAVERVGNGNTLVTSRDTRGVYEVSASGDIVWSYTSNDDPDLWPFHATRLPNGNTLIVDRWQETVIETTPGGEVVWRYGVPDVPMDPGDPDYHRNDDLEQPDPGELIDPFTAFRLPNGNTLIAENQACRVIEVRSSDYDPTAPNDGYGGSSIVWQYGVTHELASEHGYAEGYLNWPKWAVRLANGNTLIADETSHRVLEVTPGGSIAWQYGQAGVAGVEAGLLNEPVAAERLPDGSTVITDAKNDRVLRVDADGSIVWEIGAPDEYGLDSSGLAGPRRATLTDEGTLLIADSSHHRILELGYAESGLVTSARIDCDLPGVRKRFISVTANVDLPPGTSYGLLCSIDGGAWTPLDSGAMPAETFGMFLQYRVRLATTSADTTPQLVGVTVAYEPAPAEGSGEDADSTGSGGSGTQSGSSGGGTAAGSGGTGTGGTATTSVSKGAGEGYATGGPTTYLPDMEGEASDSRRGWALAYTGEPSDDPGRAAAPSPDPHGVLLLGIVYLAGAASIILTDITRSWWS